MPSTRAVFDWFEPDLGEHWIGGLCHGKLDAGMFVLSGSSRHAAATAAFHSSAASALKARSVRREMRWRCMLKVL